MVAEGTRKSMLIGVCVALLQTGIAAVIGSSAAYFGGWWERIALWTTDLLLVVPSFLIIAIISQRAGASKGSIALFIILLAGFGWMLTARVVRSLTLSVKDLDYVNAARFMKGLAAHRTKVSLTSRHHVHPCVNLKITSKLCMCKVEVLLVCADKPPLGVS